MRLYFILILNYQIPLASIPVIYYVPFLIALMLASTHLIVITNFLLYFSSQILRFSFNPHFIQAKFIFFIEYSNYQFIDLILIWSL